MPCFVFSQNKTVKLKKTFIGHTEPIKCIAFSTDGKYLASGSQDERLLSGTGKFEIIIWNINEVKPFKRLKGHNNKILNVTFDRTGKLLASSDTKGEIRIWSLDSMKQINLIDVSECINRVRFTSDSKFIIAEHTYSKKVTIWDINTSELITTLPINNQIGGMDISPDGSQISLSCYNQIQVWSLISKNKISSFDNKSVGFEIKYNNNGRKLSVGTSEGDINILDSKSLKLLNILKGHFKPVLTVAFSKDEKYLISGSSDQMVKLWDLNTSKELKSLINIHLGTINSVVFSPIKNVFATAGEDKLIKLWEIQ